MLPHEVVKQAEPPFRVLSDLMQTVFIEKFNLFKLNLNISLPSFHQNITAVQGNNTKDSIRNPVTMD